MPEVGPYSFTDHDATSTIGIMPTLFDLLTDGLPEIAGSATAPFRAAAEAARREADADPGVVLARCWTAWRDAMAAVRATGVLGPHDVGTVAALFAGDGGVPKVAADRVEVDLSGVVGDRQADRVHHGRPWQALCLWSTEVIDDFRADGHPLAPGLAGENVSITGLAWPRVRPGVLVRLGDVLAEVTSYAIPCSKNAGWFLDGRFDAMHHRHGPVSRIYALVVEPGSISVGDPVLLTTST